MDIHELMHRMLLFSMLISDSLKFAVSFESTGLISEMYLKSPKLSHIAAEKEKRKTKKVREFFQMSESINIRSKTQNLIVHFGVVHKLLAYQVNVNSIKFQKPSTSADLKLSANHQMMKVN